MDQRGSKPDQNITATHFRDARRVIGASIVCAVVLPAMYVALTAISDWDDHLAAATDTTVRAASVAQQQAVKLFDIDAVAIPALIASVSRLDSQKIAASATTIHQQLIRAGAGYPQISSINVIGKNGDLLVSSTPVNRHVSIAGREDFATVSAAPEQLYISRPMIGRITGVKTFNVAKGWRENGAFAGMVSISMRLDYYREFFRDLRSPDSPLYLGLLNSNAVPLVWYPESHRFDVEKLILKWVAAEFGQHSVSGSSRLFPSDGEAGAGSIVAYHRVGDYNSYIVAFYPLASLSTAWGKRTLHLSLTTFIPSAGIVLLLWLYLRRLNREEQAWRQLEAQREALLNMERSHEESRRLETLGNMVAVVAHDFNNILMAVTAHAARGIQDSKSRHQALMDIRVAITKGEALTRRLLGVARKQPLHEKLLDLSVWGGFSLLQPALGDSIVFEEALAEGIWLICVDENELELALLNLAMNARDAMPKGGRAMLNVANVANGKGSREIQDYVCLSFRDEGHGMDTATCERAFDPFFTTKPVGQGTGLGLAQVRSFCERAGGFVKIESAPNDGTNVSLFLPRARATAIKAVDSLTPEVVATRPMHLLFVEDDPLVAAAQQAVFESMGHTVVSVGDAQAALDVLKLGSLNFDAVVSDIQMPGEMTGVTLAAVIRGLYPELPVTLLSGYARESLEGIDSIGVGVFAKPCDPSELEKHLQASLLPLDNRLDGLPTYRSEINQ